MNRILVILNIVLLAVTGLLLVLLWSGKKNTSPVNIKADKTDAKGGTPGQFSIAYFDIDSITNNYQFCKDVKSLLERKKDEAEAKLAGLQRNYESRYNVLNQKARSMTPEEMEKARTELATMQQNIVTQKEKIELEFEQEKNDRQQDIKKNIQEFLDRYNTPRKYNFIMADEPGIFYYRDTMYNITAEVITGLNAGYKKKPAQ